MRFFLGPSQASQIRTVRDLTLVGLWIFSTRWWVFTQCNKSPARGQAMLVISQAESLSHFRSKLRYAKLRPVGGMLKPARLTRFKQQSPINKGFVYYL